MEQNAKQAKHKSGFIAVIGRPNVGKSTLINTLIGQKIAIMSDKPQTTQNRILCILTEPRLSSSIRRASTSRSTSSASTWSRRQRAP